MSVLSPAAVPPPEAAASPAAALLERYLAVLVAERNLSVYTVRNYTTDLHHLFSYLDERGVSPLALTRIVFRGYLASLIDARVAQGSITRRTSTARSFYRWLRLTGLMQDDPLASVRGPKQAKRLPHVLTVADITDLITAAEGDKPADLRDRALLELMYACGLRVSEAVSLDTGAVDLEQRSMIVTGKGNKQRRVVMGEQARAALDRYLRRGRGQLARSRRPDAPAGAESDLRPPASRNPIQALFLNRSGGRLSQRAVQLIVRKYALAAGLDEHVHPHLLRHTFATHLLDGGADLRVVQELMGHANPNTTQIYLHVTEERQRKVVEGSVDALAEVEMARRAAHRERR
jgi:site-specific recombinase XerD